MGCGQSSEPAAKAPVYVPPSDARGPAGAKLSKQVTISDYEATVHQPTRRQVTIKNFAPLTPAENGTPSITPAASGSDHNPAPAPAAASTGATEQPKEGQVVPPPVVSETANPAAEAPTANIEITESAAAPAVAQEGSQ